jgi:hypothetical protein
MKQSTILVSEPEGKDHFGDTEIKRRKKIKIHFKEIDFGDINFIYLARDNDR